MKTTINIPDSLGRRVKAIARKKGVTVTAFIEESLRRHMQELMHTEQSKEIRLTTYHGEGDEDCILNWDEIRDRVYP